VIEAQDVMPKITAPVIPESNICDRCKSENSIVKDGLRHNKSGDVQIDVRMQSQIHNQYWI
jgi:hypothetical protein